MAEERSKRIIICSNCGKEREYYAKGLCTMCYMYRWQQAHRKEVAAYNRRYREVHQEKKAAYMCRYTEEHREEKAAYDHLWNEAHREERAAYIHRWQQANPEKVAVIHTRRRAHKRGVANTLTQEQIEFERKIGEATYPGEKLHLHHLVPVSKNGGHTWGNIAFIPASLNMGIRGKLPEEVYKQLSLFEVAV